MHLGYEKNKYGNPISKHRCDSCGQEYTVCPAQEPGSSFENCLIAPCPSYDPSRDAEKLFFTEDGQLKEGVEFTTDPRMTKPGEA